MSDLNKKQKRFCEEYVIDLNGTQAAIRAGYSEKTAQEQASRLLSNVMVQEYVQKLQDEIAERNKLKADDIVQELRKIGFMTVDLIFDENGNIKNVHELDDKAKAAISSIKITERTYGKDDNETTETTKEVKLWDKGKALVELGKHMGIFKEDNDQRTIKNVIVNGEVADKVFEKLKDL